MGYVTRLCFSESPRLFFLRLLFLVFRRRSICESRNLGVRHTPVVLRRAVRDLGQVRRASPGTIGCGGITEQTSDGVDACLRASASAAVLTKTRQIFNPPKPQPRVVTVNLVLLRSTRERLYGKL